MSATFFKMLSKEEATHFLPQEVLDELCGVFAELQIFVFAVENQGDMQEAARMELPTVGDRICKRMSRVVSAVATEVMYLD